MSGYAIILLAYAQVAATLTGFIGVVFVFGERSHRLGKGQSSALFHFMYASLSALFLSLFAAVLLVYSASEEHIAWQICNALSGLIHLIAAVGSHWKLRSIGLKYFVLPLQARPVWESPQ